MKKNKLQDRKNEMRIVKRFLFLPKTIKRKTKWLCFAEISQCVMKVNGKYKWKSIKFV